jgi:flagellar basal-body rod modification protein FlgD
VQLNVRDSTGQLVRTLSLPSGSTGFSEFSWDGTGSDGARAPAGEYTLEAVTTQGGKSASLETMLAGHVSSVTIDSSNGLNLNTSNLGTFSLSQVRRVM